MIAAIHLSKKPKSLAGGTSKKQSEKYRSQKAINFPKQKNRSKTIFFLQARIKRLNSIKDKRVRARCFYNFVIANFCHPAFQKSFRELILFKSYGALKAEILSEIAGSKNKKRAVSKMVQRLKRLEPELVRMKERITKITFVPQVMAYSADVAGDVRHSLFQSLNGLGGH